MRHTYKRQTEDMLITHYIENSAVADLFDFELEYDMALEYLQIKADFRETILVNYKKAEKYCQEDHIYKFKFNSCEEFFPIINEFLCSYTGNSFFYDLSTYLSVQTTLSEICVTKVIEVWQRFVFT